MCRAVGIISSDVPVGNASWPGRNATDTATAEMGAMRPLRHVAPTARRCGAEGLPALMVNASGLPTNATVAVVQTAEMGAMKIHLSVAIDVPKTKQEAQQPPS